MTQVVVRPQGLLDLGHDFFSGFFRESPRELEEQLAKQQVFPACQAAGQLGTQVGAQPLGQGIVRRAGHHVGRRALQHGDLCPSACQGRHQRGRSGAAADHHHVFAAQIKFSWPMLWVNDATAEAAHAGEAGCMTVFVVEVAGADL